MNESKQAIFDAIGARIQEVRSQIENAKSASPFGQNVTLMAVTKTVDAERINYAIDRCGIRCIGENRVQELCEKYPLLHLDGVSVHLIGTLQSNKVKYIIDKVDMIHSLDSLPLAKEIEKQAAKHDKIMDCLIEVNVGREEAKGGILPEDTLPFFASLSPFPHIRVRGLMTIAPNTHDSAQYMAYFSEVKALYDTLCKDSAFCERLGGGAPVLSMGMSGSFSEAIRCGSHIVRIGSGIFGARG